MNDFLRYLKNGFGFSRSFYYAFNIHFTEAVAVFIWRLTLVAILLIGLLGLMQYHDDSIEEALRAQTEYSKNLENVLARCLTSSAGESVVIGNELYFCGVTNTGIKL